jgi:pyruvate,water dikinase
MLEANPGKRRRYEKDPIGTMKNYREVLEADMEQFDRVVESYLNRGNIGLNEYSEKLSNALRHSFIEELAIVYLVVQLFNKLDEKRRNGKTKEIREEYEALCGGFEGDELMETNIALYRLAQCMPEELWKDYAGENGISALTERILEERNLPAEFLNEWKSFMEKYGFDGQDQVFIACPRYSDNPELLVEKLRINALGNVKDPSVIAKDQLQKRRTVMSKQEEDAKRELAKRSTFWNKRRLQKKLAKIQRRNVILDNMMMARNAPKLHMTKLVGAMRTKVLMIEEKLLAEGRLEEKGDIFHLNTEELDQALLPEGQDRDLMKIINPRKTVYKRAVASNTCPLLVDSRCRIIRPDPPAPSNQPGTLIGAAISPGVATGKVRIIRDLSPEQTRDFGVGPDGKEEKHVLCAVVTGPAWTPLFASASAVVLQIGGVLQHGALCAREYGKPAVSNIDVHSVLKDGMIISVDGNTGIVEILDEGNEN